MVMTANNVTLPKWGGEVVETHTCVNMHWYHFKIHYIKPSYIHSNDFWQGCQDGSTGKWHLFQKLMLRNWVSTCKRVKLGTSLVIQWLRLCVPKAGGPGLIPGQGTRSHIPHLQGSQINVCVCVHVCVLFNCSVWLCNSMYLAHQAPCPWNSPGKNTEVGILSLLQGIFPTQGLNLGLSNAGRFFTIWATREAQMNKFFFLMKLDAHFTAYIKINSKWKKN